MALEVSKSLEVNKEALNAAMGTELYATEKVYELVKKGMSFRQAYADVKKTINKSLS